MAHLLIRKVYYTVGSECEAWLCGCDAWIVRAGCDAWIVRGMTTFSVFGRSDLVNLGLAKIFKGPDGALTSFNMVDFNFIRNWIM